MDDLISPKSGRELLNGMKNLRSDERIPEEVFITILDIKDNVEKAAMLEDARRIFTDLKRGKEFDRLYKEYLLDYIQKMKNSEHWIEFTDLPEDAPKGMSSGPWRATDIGVFKSIMTEKGKNMIVSACSHPLLPVAIYKDLDDFTEKVKILSRPRDTWQYTIFDRSVCSNANKIVDALSPFGIDVTSENAKALVKYISDVIGLNTKALMPKDSVGRLGWTGNRFIPYEDNISYNGDPAYMPIYNAVKEAGNEAVWMNLCSRLRKEDLPLRIMMDSAFASALLTPIGALPFICHVWGGSGTGKTVSLMVAMSIWGNPDNGKLVKTLNTTATALTSSAAFLYSIPLAGDELQTMKDRWQGNFDQLIYKVTEGIDRGRATRSGGVQATKSWRNAFIFTGEEPITKATSNAGSKNRVIEIAVEESMIYDGHDVSNLVKENYGFAGKKFVRYLQGASEELLKQRYKELVNQIMKLDTTDKQAMAMACIVLADQIAEELFFKGETPLTVSMIERYLHKSSEVDVAERAYSETMNWVARNWVRFQDAADEDSVNRGEIWGKVSGEQNQVLINKSMLEKFLSEMGLDYTVLTKDWRKKGYLIPSTTGKNVHRTSIRGVMASYVKLQTAEKDKNGFLSIEDDEAIPFEV